MYVGQIPKLCKNCALIFTTFFPNNKDIRKQPKLGYLFVNSFGKSIFNRRIVYRYKYSNNVPNYTYVIIEN